MKIKIGPIEFEQDPIKDEALFEEYKNSPKKVEKYLTQKSKFYDLSLKNILAGKTMKMIRNFIFTICGCIFFTAWSIYVFYISRDSFVWKDFTFQSVVEVILQALLAIFICFLPAGLISGFALIIKKISSSQEAKRDKLENRDPEDEKD